MTRQWKDTIADLLSWCPPRNVRLTFRADNQSAEILVRLFAGDACLDVVIVPGSQAETFAGLDAAAEAVLAAAVRHLECLAEGGCDHCRIRIALADAAATFEGFVAGLAIVGRKGAG